MTLRLQSLMLIAGANDVSPSTKPEMREILDFARHPKPSHLTHKAQALVAAHGHAMSTKSRV